MLVKSQVWLKILPIFETGSKLDVEAALQELTANYLLAPVLFG